MTKFILGTKIGMTQIYDDKGNVTPVTLVEIASNVVVRVKNKEKDGYEAIQVGTGVKRKLSAALRGHFKGLGSFRFLREFRVPQLGDPAIKAGDKLEIGQFSVGDMVKVSGVSKGKGFAGAMKRHGFSGMPHSHGHHHVARHIGSIGQRFPQHTLKGKRMAGHMGNERVTVRGLKIVTVDIDNNLIAIKGAVPGNRGALLEIVAQ